MIQTFSSTKRKGDSFEQKNKITRKPSSLSLSSPTDVINLPALIYSVRGLLFKFVDFLYSRSKVFDRVIKIISSENIFFSQSFDV